MPRQPIKIGYQLHSCGSANVAVSGHLTGGLKFGMSYVKDRVGEDDMQMISRTTFDAAGQLDSFDASLTAKLNVYILSVPVITINYLGSVNVGIRTYIESSFDAEVGAGYYQASCPGAASASVATTAGAHVSIGASIGLALPNLTPWQYTFPQTTIGSTQVSGGSA